MKLSLLNPTQAQGPDGLPAWLLKENADLVAEPIAEIINSSFRESRLPPSCKKADIVPVPKQRIVKDVRKHLRPISLTAILSKVAEEYIRQEYVKPAVLIKIKSNQFGSIPKSSTTQALISMIHTWRKYNSLYSQSGCFRLQKSFRPDRSQYIGSETKIYKYPP